MRTLKVLLFLFIAFLALTISSCVAVKKYTAAKEYTNVKNKNDAKQKAEKVEDPKDFIWIIQTDL